MSKQQREKIGFFFGKYQKRLAKIITSKQIVNSFLIYIKI